MTNDRGGSPRRQLPGLLSDEDLRLWREVARGVRPLPGRLPPPAPVPAQPAVAPAPLMPPPARSVPVRPPPPRPVPVPEAKHGQVAGLDRRSAQRLKRGQMTIDGRIDLHGLTQEEAHRALNSFIGSSLAAGRRAILVIT